MWIGCSHCLWGAALGSIQAQLLVSLENCLSTQHLYKQHPLPVHKEPCPVEGGISTFGG